MLKKIIPFYSKDKKEFLKLLTQKIIEFSNTHPNFTYQNIIDEFGSPNEVAGSYIESLENDDIIKQLNKNIFLNISNHYYIYIYWYLVFRNLSFQQTLPRCKR